MRPKFVFALCLVVVLGAIFFLRHYRAGTTAKPEPPANAEIAASVAIPETNTTTNVAMVGAPVAPLPSAATNVLTPEQREEAIDAEKDRLYQWSMNDDVASLSAILNDLTNSEKEVRLAAIEAAKQFGSSNAIPTLKADAANAQDTEEQIALLQAADFLSLPSLADREPMTPEQIQAAKQASADAAARRLQASQTINHQPAPQAQSQTVPNAPPGPGN